MIHYKNIVHTTLNGVINNNVEVYNMELHMPQILRMVQCMWGT